MFRLFQKLIIVFVSLVISQLAYGQIEFRHQIIYTHFLKPDSVVERPLFVPEIPATTSYSIQFNDTYALRREELVKVQTSLTYKPVADEPVDGFTLTNTDSNYSIVKQLGCSQLRKIALGQLPKMNKIGDTIIIGKECQVYRYFALNEPNDFYLTEALPKAAGIVVAKNVNSCIIGYRRRGEFCIAQQMADMPDTFSLPLVPANQILLEGKQCMRGGTANLQENSAFPSFNATTLDGRSITEAEFKTYPVSVVLIISKLNGCQKPNPSFARFFNNEQEQNQELAKVISKFSLEPHIGTYIITEDYAEELRSLNFEHTTVISNAELWKQQVNINYGPVVLIVANGIVKRIATPFDFTEENDLDSLKNLIRTALEGKKPNRKTSLF